MFSPFHASTALPQLLHVGSKLEAALLFTSVNCTRTFYLTFTRSSLIWKKWQQHNHFQPFSKWYNVCCVYWFSEILFHLIWWNINHLMVFPEYTNSLSPTKWWENRINKNKSINTNAWHHTLPQSTANLNTFNRFSLPRNSWHQMDQFIDQQQ